jgi:hypothetical protein
MHQVTCRCRNACIPQRGIASASIQSQSTHRASGVELLRDGDKARFVGVIHHLTRSKMLNRRCYKDRPPVLSLFHRFQNNSVSPQVMLNLGFSQTSHTSLLKFPVNFPVSQAVS